MEWQTMDSAPRDESEILIFAKSGIGEVWFRMEDFVCIGRVYENGRAVAAHSDAYTIELEATHWMPLPEPPTER